MKFSVGFLANLYYVVFLCTFQSLKIQNIKSKMSTYWKIPKLFSNFWKPSLALLLETADTRLQETVGEDGLVPAPVALRCDELSVVVHHT